jgi:hypothetical protein
VDFKIDKTKPETTHSLDPASPDGENGWYVSDISVKLSPTDATSGVWHTYYRIDGGDWKKGTSFTIDEDGEHTVDYYSVDIAGNEESPYHSFSVKLDETAPKVGITTPMYKYLYIFGKPILPINKTIIIGKLTTGADAHDGTSGMARVEFYVDGNLTAIDTTSPYEWDWNVVSFFMFHDFKVIAYDQAGNSASATIYIDIVLYLGIM